MTTSRSLIQDRFTAMDVFVGAVIVALGVLQFILYQRAPDFLYGDVEFAELAKSLLHGTYSFNSGVERIQPPGFPAILALVCSTIGSTHDVLVRTIPVFFTLGLLSSYGVICRQIGRPTAAAICLLLASSPSIFVYSTKLLWPSFPYFWVSMLFLYLAPMAEVLKNWSRSLVLACVLCLLLVGTVLIQSVGIALIGGLLSWMTLSFFGDRSVAKARLKFFLPIVAIALLVEALWLQRGGNPKEWPLPGYQDSYLVQLKVKSGNYPELGFASPRDVVVRVENNLKERTSFLGEVLTQRWIKPTWASPLIVGLLVLVLLGVGCSLLRRDSQLCALYFIGYECIYLLWPWSFDVPRFTLPVLPLAFLYLAEGGMALASWSRQYPRRVGAIFLPLVIILTVLAGVQMRRAETGYGLQEKISMIFWLGCTFVCARLAWSGPLPSWNGLSRWQILVGKEHSIAGLFFNLVHLMGALVVIYLILIGVAADFSIGRENLVSGRIKFENTPEIQAARWINSHTDPDTIVASRHVELIYHYSGRRVIWFPPITNPKILMDGIRQYHIRYVVIVDRSFHYYLPPDTTCFELLLNAYPNSFGLVKQQGRLRIYEVLPDSATQPRAYPDVPWSTLFHSENEHPVTFAV